MSYQVIIAPEAQEHMREHARYGRKLLLKKIEGFLDEISEHPRTGTGKPERLRHYEDQEVWSRRIDERHRLRYEIKEDRLIVIAISAAGHYEDK